MQTCDKPFPLTLSQQDIYFDQLRHPQSPIYNVGGYIRMGDITPDIVIEAHKTLVEQEELFGLRICASDEGVGQRIELQRDTYLAIVDFSESENALGAAHQWIKNLFESPQEFENVKLYKSFLLKLNDRNYWYVGFAHHLMMDGWGFANWARKLGQICGGLSLSREKENGEWREIARQDQEYLSSAKYQKDKLYWQQHSQTHTSRILTPYYDAEYPNNAVRPSGREVINLPHELYGKVESFAREYSFGVSTIFLGALATYFFLAYSKFELNIGVPTHNRKNHRQKQSLGVFTNINFLNIFIDKSMNFLQLLEDIVKQQKQLLRHARYPTSHIIRDSGMSAREDAPYEVGFNYLKLDSELVYFDNDADLVYVSHHHERSALMINLWEYGSCGSELQLDYNLSYFTQVEAKLLGERLVHILSELLFRPASFLTSLKPLPEQEIQQLLAFNTPLAPFPHASIDELFSLQATKTPNAKAVSCNGKSLNYRELNEMSEQLAHKLKALDIKSGERVALYLERSVEMVVAILAIFKAGAAYVPLDPMYPNSRLRYMLEDSGVNLMFTESDRFGEFETEKLACLDLVDTLNELKKSPPVPFRRESFNGDELAYVVYTSGSTGKPKAVKITHKNAVSMLTWGIDFYSSSVLRVGLVASSIGFDYSVFELFLPLLSGGEALIVENVLSLSNIDPECELTLINTVPSALEALLGADIKIPTSVKAINLGGEVLSRSLVTTLYERSEIKQLYNLYGPSECTTLATLAEITPKGITKPKIGRPIGNSYAYVLDTQGQLSPIGIPGELFIGGYGVSPGYVNRPRITKELFVRDPFSNDPEAKLYRTGDLVRYCSDGQLEYISRIDDQIKIRGFRVELGEIEHHLLDVKGVDSALVISRKSNNGVELLAFVVTPNNEVLVSIREEIEKRLPRYMWPVYYRALRLWPLTPNGKVNKAALLAQINEDDIANEEGSAYESVSGGVETELAAIWADLLDLSKKHIGCNSNFFTLGGHSLLSLHVINEVRDRFDIELSVEEVFNHPYLRQLAHCINSKTKGNVGSRLLAGKRPQNLPLSFAQQRLWLVDRLYEGSAHYNMPLALNVCGKFDTDCFEKALTIVVSRHEILRTRYISSDDGAHQVIDSPRDFTLTKIDLRNLQGTSVVTNEHIGFYESVEQRTQVQRLAEIDASNPFDLSVDLMLRASWILLAKNENDIYGVLLFNMHHISADGWSVNVLINELSEIYNALFHSRTPNLPDLSVQYVDYALWQRDYFSGEHLQKQIDYWREQLLDAPSVHSLPLDFERPIEPCYRGSKYLGELSKTDKDALVIFANAHSVSPFMLIHAAFSLLIAKHSYSPDVIIGIPVANRLQKALHPLIGFFVNILVLRINVDEETMLFEFLDHIRKVNIQAQSHQDLPFELLLEHLPDQRSMHHNPLFQIMLSMENADLNDLVLESSQISVRDSMITPLKFDLELSIRMEDCIAFDWFYDSALFKESTISRLHQHLCTIIRAMIGGKNRQLSELPMLSKEEIKTLLPKFPLSQDPISVSGNLLDEFEQQVSKSPNAPALHWRHIQLNYSELNLYIDRLALGLIEHQACQKPIGVCVDGPLFAVVAMLGIWRAGGTFVPLDPINPSARLEKIVTSCGIESVVSQVALTQRINVEKVTWFLLDEASFDADYQAGRNSVMKDSLQMHISVMSYSGSISFSERLSIRSNELAYIIYTSGTSGMPKGVAVEHASIQAHITTTNKVLNLNAGHNVLQCAPYSVDAFLEQTIGALVQGAQVHFRDSLLWDASAFFDYVQQNLITHIDISPVYLAELLNAPYTPTEHSPLKCIVVGGETLPRHVVSRWKTHKLSSTCKLFNAYGPTETTVTATMFEVDRATGSPMIGKPLPGRYVYVVDRNMQLAPQGVVGELLIGGNCVARGYINHDDVKEPRFIDDPFLPSVHKGRLYKTGDLVRLNDDGNLQYCGRIDEQIKVRGYRIEVDEIENQLTSLADVKDVKVALRGKEVLRSTENSDHDIEETERLIAYIVLNSQQANNSQGLGEQFKQKLRQLLPEPMIPDAYVFLDVFPLNSSGKVDQKELMTLSIDSECFSDAFVTSTEKKLAELWLSVLPSEQVGRNDNFFELGGNSLSVVKLVHRVQVSLEISVTPREIFENPGLQAQAEYIDAKVWLANNKPFQTENTETYQTEQFIEYGEV